MCVARVGGGGGVEEGSAEPVPVELLVLKCGLVVNAWRGIARS